MGETRINVKNMTDQTKAEVIYQNNITYTPKVSVIIPVYNVEPYLRQCLDSVINQTLKDIEIICIDDGSTDNSLSILKEYAEKDNRITVLSQQNLHAGVARNAGLAVAKGEYLSFLDSDDFFELNMLEELYHTATQNNSDIVMCDTWLFDEKKNEDVSVDWTLCSDKVKNPNAFCWKDIPEDFFKLSNCWVWNRLYKSSFIKGQDLKFQDLGCANDIYFSCIAGVLAKKISLIKKRFIHYRINQKMKNNLTSIHARKIYPTEMLRCFFSIFYKLQDLGNYKLLRSSYLHVAVESLYWTMKGLKNDPTAYCQFKDYLKNYKDILSDLSPIKGNDTLSLKYSILRNILIDEGVYHEIPKRIFYVWGAHEALKPDVVKCIDTWKEFLPDYEIVQIDEESVDYFDFQKELKENKWFRTVYERKMWAYVADYIRIKTLYLNGGIYFDTDVSVVQNMDKLLAEPAFVGIQCSSVDGTGDWVEPAICGAQKNNAFWGKVLSFYDTLIWEKPIYTMPQVFDYFLRESDIFPFPSKSEQQIIKLPDLTIYPEQYFIPFRFRQKYSDDCVTKNTYTIHWWGGSWTKPDVFNFLKSKHEINKFDNTIETIIIKNTAFKGYHKNSNYLSLPDNDNISLEIQGKNNTVVIAPQYSGTNISIQIVGNNNFVKIDSSSIDLSLHIGFKTFNRFANNSEFIFGKNNCSRLLQCYVEESNSSIIVGDDNLFSWGVELRNSDSHSIIDQEGKVINRADSIKIGNHNWICKDVTFLKNSAIGNDCVCGYRSVISKKFSENNVIIAGIPARITKTGINWSGTKADVYSSNFSEYQLTVIIPVYNTEKYLKECLDSVINQTLKNIEILCVNDGSTDNSSAILEEYAKKDQRIHIISQENAGLSVSRNRAIEAAKGKYILFLDSDDYIKRDCCEKLYQKAENCNIEMLNFAGTNFDNDTGEFKQLSFQTIFYTECEKSCFERHELEQFINNVPISACRYFYKKSFLTENKILFPEHLCFEDNYFVRKALIFVKRFGIERETLYFRRVHSESITQNLDKHFADLLKIVSLIQELYVTNKVNPETIKDTINMYCKSLYRSFCSFPFQERRKYFSALLSLIDKMQRQYKLNKDDFRQLYQPYRRELEAWYERAMKKPLNLDNPKTFNEKIQWLKLYDSTPIKTRLADKYLVRDWVKEKIGEEYLIPLLGVYDSFEEIDFDQLPDQFVIKCNHGCGYNIIVKDKSKLDLVEVKAKLDQWMEEDFAFRCGFELHYSNIHHKIIIEKFIENTSAHDLYDYKFWCFGGKVYYIQFLSERNLSGLKMAFYDKDWKKQSFVYSYPLDEKNIEKPDNLDLMISLAEKLATGFPHVRVDFYRLDDGTIIFGEMTFTSASGSCKWNNEKINRHFGDLIKLPGLAYDIHTGEYYKLPKLSWFDKFKQRRKAREQKKQLVHDTYKKLCQALRTGKTEIINNSTDYVALSVKSKKGKVSAIEKDTRYQVENKQLKETIKLKVSGKCPVSLKFSSATGDPLIYKSIRVNKKEILSKPVQVRADQPFSYEFIAKPNKKNKIEIQKQYYPYKKHDLQIIAGKLGLNINPLKQRKKAIRLAKKKINGGFWSKLFSVRYKDNKKIIRLCGLKLNFKLKDTK